MFNWLKKLVKNEPATAKDESVAIAELERWFSSKVNLKFSIIKESIHSYYSRIYELKEDVLEKMEKLQKAELMNKNMPEKVMQIMEGNRQSYIEKTNMFLSKISAPKDITLKTTVEFCGMVEGNLAELAKSNVRGYAIMQEFFANESKAVAMSIKSIEQQVIMVRDLLNRKSGDLTKAEQTKDLIGEYIHLVNLSRKMRDDLQMYEGQLRFIEEKDAEFDKRKEKLRQSNDFSILNRKNEEIAKAKHDIESIKARLAELFSPVSKAMKKYEHICFEDKDLLVQYNSDEFEAIQNDPGFRIINILQVMKKALDKDELEIKDKQKQKMIASIDGISEEVLKGFADLIKDGKKSLKQLTDEVSGLGISDMIKDVDYRKQHLKDKQKMIMIEMEKAKKIMSKFSLDDIEKRIVNEIMQIVNISVTIMKPAEQQKAAEQEDEEESDEEK